MATVREFHQAVADERKKFLVEERRQVCRLRRTLWKVATMKNTDANEISVTEGNHLLQRETIFSQSVKNSVK